jgi:hypothetical protein
MLGTFISLSLFGYLLLMGSHVVAARIWQQVWQAPSEYLNWWVNLVSVPTRFFVLYFLPVVIFTLLQVRLLRKALARG